MHSQFMMHGQKNIKLNKACLGFDLNRRSISRLRPERSATEVTKTRNLEFVTRFAYR